MDIRVRRTHDMLFAALTELLENNRLDDITVNEICARSTVHRTTFYKHFDDKYDFYRAYLEYVSQTFIEQAPDADALDDVDEYCRYMLNLLIDFIDGHAGIIKRFTDDAVTGAVLDMMVKEMARGVATRLQLEEGGALDIPPMLLAVFYSGGLVQTLRWWLNENRPITKHQLITGLDKIGLF